MAAIKWVELEVQKKHLVLYYRFRALSLLRQLDENAADKPFPYEMCFS